MRQIDDPPPNLWQSRGRWRGLGSKGWVPRTSAQRVGALIVGAGIVAGGLMMLVSSFGVKQELQNLIPSQAVGLMVSFLAVMMVLAVASWLIGFGGRLLTGCFRHSPVREGRR
jgi:VIT1/CCC1 family predicted Fe2+/Mn2+ transporter